MARMDRYRQRRGQARLRNLLLFLSALVIIAGLSSRWKSSGILTAEALSAPTSTPIAAAFDETMETRELTLPAVTWYTIQTGLFTAREAAQQCADQYADRGAPGLVVKDGEKFRVLIASYGQQADAAAVREHLAREQQVETCLFEWASPEITLRLTGMAGQLDVAEAGLTLMQQTASQLRDAAIQLDAGGLLLGDVRALIDELDSQLTLWSATARKRFSMPYPVLIDMQLTIADAWPSLRQTLLQAANENAANASAALKLAAMRLFGQAAAMRAALG